MTPAAAIRHAIAALEAQAAALRQALADLEPEACERWLSPKQAAFLVRISRRQMYRLAPKLGVMVGGQWRIDASRLKAHMAKNMANDGERRRISEETNQGKSDHEN